jgi:hypothetical protein
MQHLPRNTQQRATMVTGYNMAHPRTRTRYVAACMWCACMHLAASAAAAPHLLGAMQADPDLTTLSAMVEKGGMTAALQDASLQVW